MRFCSVFAAGVLVLAACGGEETPRVPESVVVVDDSTGRLVTPPVPSPDGTRLAFTRVVSGRSSVFVSAADGSNAVQVSHGVWDTAPVWSPDSKWIAYAGEDPDFDVFVVPSDGSAPARQLTSGPAFDTPTRWLRDGSGIVVDRQRVGDDYPLVVTLDGAPPRRIGPVMAGNLHAVWSPDGARLGFDLHEGGRNTVWVQDSAAGSQPRQLTTEGLENGPISMWSPDSRHVAYTSRRTGTRDIWIMDVTTGESRQLTNDIREDFAPRWSPDGNWIAFLSDRGGQHDVWLMPAAGGSAVRLTNDTAVETAPEWSADGRSLYFRRTTTSVEFQVVPVAGGAARSVRAWEDYSVGSARLSPDGNTVLFDTDRVGNGEILALPVAGGEPVPFAPSPRRDFAARYSPDGSQVAFLSDRGGSLDLWLAPASGGEPRNLSSAPGDEGEAFWSPDGTRIAFSSNRDVGGSDLWVIEAAGGAPTRLTTQNLRPSSIQWSPDGTSLYFTGQKPGESGGQDVYRVPAAGGRVEALGLPSTTGFQRVSHDGRQMVYATFEGGWAYLHQRAVAGGPSQRITRETENVYHLAAFWAPGDSTLLVIALDLTANTDASDLWTYRPSDGTWNRLTNTKWHNEEPTLRFLSDGKEVFIISRGDRSDIRRVSVAGVVGR